MSILGIEDLLQSRNRSDSDASVFSINSAIMSFGILYIILSGFFVSDQGCIHEMEDYIRLLYSTNSRYLRLFTILLFHGRHRV